MKKAPDIITLWTVGKKNGGLFLQNGYPFLVDTKEAAKNWCNDDEKPVRVQVKIVAR